MQAEAPFCQAALKGFHEHPHQRNDPLGRNAIEVTYNKLLLCTPACTRRFAGKGELVLDPTHLGLILPQRGPDANRQVLPVFLHGSRVLAAESLG